MSNEVIDALRRVIPAKSKRSGRGWIDFNCPSCGDRRGRGGLLETPTGGFRYRCFNGGCQHEQGTGWEPNGPLIGRARRLFLDLNGDLSDIPAEFLNAKPVIHLSRKDWIDHMMADHTAALSTRESTIATIFPEIELPPRTELLWNSTNPKAIRVQEYVLARGDIYITYPFCWSPEHPLYVITPFQYRDSIIGWIGRRIIKDKQPAHLKCPGWPSDYMLNQDRVHDFPIILVMEGSFDAIALNGLCTFGNTITDKQINLLKQSGKKIVLVPDYKGQEWRPYWQTAKKYGWYLSLPEWGGDYQGTDHIKDPGDAIKRMGLLCTMQKLLSRESITDNYFAAEMELNLRTQG